jgi:hypothetical protein
LSDIALKWMLTWASIVPDGIKFNRSVLNPYPLSDGKQHDECKAGVGLITKLTGYTWPEKHRTLPGDPPQQAIMHRSVYERFDAQEVLQYDVMQAYRPPTLRQHVDFIDAYKGGARSQDPVAVAMYVEDRLGR